MSEEDETTEYQRKRPKGTLKSGYCLTAFHTSCSVKFSYGTCPCDCHSPTPAPKAKATKRAARKRVAK